MATLGNASHEVEAGAASALAVKIDVADVYVVAGDLGVHTVEPDGVFHAVSEGENDVSVIENRRTVVGDLESHSNPVKGLIIRGALKGAIAMNDGYGIEISYEHEDNAAVKNEVAILGTARNGADDEADLTISTANGAAPAEWARLTKVGYFGLGVNPAYPFDLKGSIVGSVANFFNDNGTEFAFGLRVQAGLDAGPGINTVQYLSAKDGDGDGVGYIADVSGTFNLVDE
ncbi:MAG: hypothetical protein GY923_15470 [Aestuariibacter sp.]|nr:hypothetical protein [Aestuariibacter sp.]